jgi:hypothetical protein
MCGINKHHERDRKQRSNSYTKLYTAAEKDYARSATKNGMYTRNARIESPV